MHFTNDDRRLLIQALAQYAGNPNDLDAEGRRAYRLIEEIAAESDHSASELVR
jgi:hypothetical protein